MTEVNKKNKILIFLLNNWIMEKKRNRGKLRYVYLLEDNFIFYYLFLKKNIRK